MEKPKAILKVGANELKYNHELFATFIIIKDNKFIKLIKYVYQINKCAIRIL